jgi:hypothetical protein
MLIQKIIYFSIIVSQWNMKYFLTIENISSIIADNIVNGYQ